MRKVLIYHNGECSKCKELSELLQARELEVTYKFYLHEPLTVDELKGLLVKLQQPVSAIIRTSEPLYTEMYEGKDLTDEAWLQVIADNPVLLQRPILVLNDAAVIARPAEKALAIL